MTEDWKDAIESPCLQEPTCFDALRRAFSDGKPRGTSGSRVSGTPPEEGRTEHGGSHGGLVSLLFCLFVFFPWCKFIHSKNMLKATSKC